MPRELPNTGCGLPTCTAKKCTDESHFPENSAPPAATSRTRKADPHELSLEERIALELFIGNGNLHECFPEAERFVETLRLRRKRKQEKPLLETIAEHATVEAGSLCPRCSKMSSRADDCSWCLFKFGGANAS